jgi:hypothetical protein
MDFCVAWKLGLEPFQLREVLRAFLPAEDREIGDAVSGGRCGRGPVPQMRPDQLEALRFRVEVAIHGCLGAKELLEVRIIGVEAWALTLEEVRELCGIVDVSILDGHSEPLRIRAAFLGTTALGV